MLCFRVREEIGGELSGDRWKECSTIGRCGKFLFGQDGTEKPWRV